MFHDHSPCVSRCRYPSVNNTNSSCSCQSSFDCAYPAGIYSKLSGIDAFGEYGRLQSSHVPDFTLPGMLVGCFPLNVLLQSTLECLFNSTCLTVLQSSLLVSLPLSVTPLNDDGQSRFSLKTTVQVIVDELLIEHWIGTSNYSAFYGQCNPTRCTYSYMPKVNVTLIISTIISLFGGLCIALKIAALILIRASRKIRAKVQKIKAKDTNHTASNIDRKWIENNHMYISSKELGSFCDTI